MLCPASQITLLGVQTSHVVERLLGLVSRHRRRTRLRAGHGQEGRTQHLVVDELGALGLREDEPDDSERLEGVVEGEPVSSAASEKYIGMKNPMKLVRKPAKLLLACVPTAPRTC